MTVQNRWCLLMGLIVITQFSAVDLAAAADATPPPAPPAANTANNNAATPKAAVGELAPEWVLEIFPKLVESGVLRKSEYRVYSTGALSREEASVLAAKAIWRLEDAPNIEGAPPSVMVAASRSQVEKLKKEFSYELANLGYGAVGEARRPVLGDAKRFKFSGEARYNYVSNDGTKRTLKDDSRLRLRFHGSWNFNDNWAAHTMVESDKSFLDSEKRDGHPDWNRFYVTGKSGITNVTAGRFGYLLAEGNIYDSSMEGAIFEFDTPVKMRVGLAKAGENNDVGLLTSAHYETNDYNLEGGFYRYNENPTDQTNTIGFLGGNYFLGRYYAGAMHLRSTSADRHGDNNGYVFTVGYGTLKTWMPGSFSVYGKFYDQARGTYISHTMTGAAGYMEGFRGFGTGMYYTIANNVVYGLEYYDLKDKVTGDTGRTLWNQVSYYF